MKNIILIVLMIVEVLFAQESIYNSKVPHIVPVWHRVADFGSVLRAVESAEISPNGLFVASASKFSYNVMLWSTKDGSLLWESTHDSEVECITFSPDNQMVASGDEDFLTKIYNVRTGKLIKELEHDSGVDGIAWSNNGKVLAGGTEKGDIWFWDTKDFKLLYKENFGSTINSLQFTKDDMKILCGGNIQTVDPISNRINYSGFATLFDIENKKEIQKYLGNTASVKSVRMSNNEKYIATGSFDSTACLFDLNSGKLLNVFNHKERVEAVAFTPDGEYLLSGGHESKISFYKTDNYSLAYELNCPRTEYIDFSDDGRLMVTAHEDSGLLSLYLFVSDLQNKGDLYQKLSNDLLNNRDLKKK